MSSIWPASMSSVSSLPACAWNVSGGSFAWSRDWSRSFAAEPAPPATAPLTNLYSGCCVLKTPTNALRPSFSEPAAHHVKTSTSPPPLALDDAPSDEVPPPQAARASGRVASATISAAIGPARLRVRNMSGIRCCGLFMVFIPLGRWAADDGLVLLRARRTCAVVDAEPRVDLEEVQRTRVDGDLDGLTLAHLGPRVEPGHQLGGPALVLRVGLEVVGRADVLGKLPGVRREHGRRLDLEVGDDLGAQRLA